MGTQKRADSPGRCEGSSELAGRCHDRSRLLQLFRQRRSRGSNVRSCPEQDRICNSRRHNNTGCATSNWGRLCRYSKQRTKASSAKLRTKNEGNSTSNRHRCREQLSPAGCPGSCSSTPSPRVLVLKRDVL